MVEFVLPEFYLLGLNDTQIPNVEGKAGKWKKNF